MRNSGKMRFLVFICIVMLSATAMAASEKSLYSVNVDVSNESSLQRGARLFVNYCMGCHSAKYMRYERVGLDLGIPEGILSDNMIFGDKTIYDTMETSMRMDLAPDWFLGMVPPDLSLTARSKGADWIYSYLTTFYIDPDRPTGVNNLQFPGTAMPNVLWELRGHKKPVYSDNGSGEIVGLETMVPGEMSDAEYERAITDLVNFMVYISEPAQLVRTTMGRWVILYLLILLVVAYLLKKEYWKDVR
jgi:ubiquinol-cytochrome c reductase cytochrome c1 subunit